MDIAQLVLDAFIFLGIFYVAFIQDRITKIKDKLLETLKEYPEAAEAFIRMERRRIEERVESEFTESLMAVMEEMSEIEERNKEKIGKVIFELGRLIGETFRAVGRNPLFERFIDGIEYPVVRNTVREFYDQLEGEVESQT